MSEIENYLEQVKIFKATTPMEATALLKAKAGHIVFIGRETCPYCRRFAAKLSEVAQAEQLTVHYVHAQDPAYPQEILAFRQKFDIPTVPGFLYSDEAGLKVKCDSSMSPEEIVAFVKA